MSNIVRANQGAQISTLDDLARFAKMSYESGMFKDLKAVTQAAVKAQVAMELGISPMLGLSAIHIVEGRPTLSAAMLAALMKRSGYSWKIVAHTEDECRLEIRSGGESLGECGFTLGEAKAAGLLGRPNWSKHRRDMLFARAISRAARWFAPEVALGVYTPEELGGDENATQEYEPISEPPPSPIPPPQQITAAPSEPEPVFEASFEEEPLPPTSEIRNLNPRATMVKKIHARLREVGLDHDELKKLLPETWSFKTASESDLDCVNAIIQCRSLDDLRQQWNFLTKNSLASGLNDVKNYMKAALEARA